MKKLIIITLFIFIAKLSFSQWQWAKQIGGPNYDGGGILIDANNNIYCGGVFTGSCYFDNDTLNSLGINDIFLAKYDVSGNELWSKRIGGLNPINFDEYPGGFVIDNNNNCLYFSGQFYNTLTIDSYSVPSSGQLDMFLAKFDLSGNCLWLKKAGGPLNDEPATVSLDANGNIYWTGKLGSNGTFDTFNLNEGTFLSKLNSDSTVLWARNQITGGYPTWTSVKNNELIMSGVTRNDTIIIDIDTLISTSQVDAFLSKLDTNGNVIWSKRFGGHTNNDFAGNFEIDVNNNIFLVGGFDDSITINSTTLSNNGKRDIYFAEFDGSGNLNWIKQINPTGNLNAGAYGINKDIDGNFYIVGTFSGSATFGSYSVSASSNQDMFLARYDAAGDCVGIRHFGEAQAYGVQCVNNGDVIVSGIFANTVNIGGTSLTSHGSLDMFFAKSDAITGIGGEERVVNSQLIIYANPNAGKCNITIPDDFLHDKNLTLSIYDNKGKLIQQKLLEMHDGKIKLSLEAEAKGVYNVMLGNGKKSYNGKIVFE